MARTRLLASLFLLLLALCSSVSAQQRTITISHVKDEPVEIVGLKLKEVSIQPEVSFQAAEGWTKDLEIKIKNVSDEPISFNGAHSGGRFAHGTRHRCFQRLLLVWRGARK